MVKRTEKRGRLRRNNIMLVVFGVMVKGQGKKHIHLLDYTISVCVCVRPSVTEIWIVISRDSFTHL